MESICFSREETWMSWTSGMYVCCRCANRWLQMTDRVTSTWGWVCSLCFIKEMLACLLVSSPKSLFFCHHCTHACTTNPNNNDSCLSVKYVYDFDFCIVLCCAGNMWDRPRRLRRVPLQDQRGMPWYERRRLVRPHMCSTRESKVEVYVGSTMGPGVQWDTVTENHVVPVHHKMSKYTIIPSSPGPIVEHQVPLNPRIPLPSSVDKYWWYLLHVIFLHSTTALLIK